MDLPREHSGIEPNRHVRGQPSSRPWKWSIPYSRDPGLARAGGVAERRTPVGDAERRQISPGQSRAGDIRPMCRRQGRSIPSSWCKSARKSQGPSKNSWPIITPRCRRQSRPVRPGELPRQGRAGGRESGQRPRRPQERPGQCAKCAASIENARAEVANQRANVERVQVEIADAKRNLERQRTLFARQLTVAQRGRGGANGL